MAPHVAHQRPYPGPSPQARETRSRRGRQRFSPPTAPTAASPSPSPPRQAARGAPKPARTARCGCDFPAPARAPQRRCWSTPPAASRAATVSRSTSRSAPTPGWWSRRRRPRKSTARWGRTLASSHGDARRRRRSGLAAPGDHPVRSRPARPHRRYRVGADRELLFAETVVFGRAAMGETVRDGRFTDRWRVRRDGRLIFAENFRLDGADRGASRRARHRGRPRRDRHRAAGPGRRRRGRGGARAVPGISRRSRNFGLERHRAGAPRRPGRCCAAPRSCCSVGRAWPRRAARIWLN